MSDSGTGHYSSGNGKSVCVTGASGKRLGLVRTEAAMGTPSYSLFGPLERQENRPSRNRDSHFFLEQLVFAICTTCRFNKVLVRARCTISIRELQRQQAKIIEGTMLKKENLEQWCHSAFDCCLDAGFIACYVIKELLRRGYNVRGTVRDASDEKRTQYIRNLVSRQNSEGP